MKPSIPEPLLSELRQMTERALEQQRQAKATEGDQIVARCLALAPDRCRLAANEGKYEAVVYCSPYKHKPSFGWRWTLDPLGRRVYDGLVELGYRPKIFNGGYLKIAGIKLRW